MNMECEESDGEGVEQGGIAAANGQGGNDREVEWGGSSGWVLQADGC